ncbi:DNA integrity scanning diadenylate cyclase DisA [Blastococcus brunescens]|uniref:DNA integrity scanning diadenylate cyclase DisA n=1 Tax=Blastococcus brunescens TaxID=1564165 RepID=A0ABZ1B187_9ACTN|nr:DNA integrity scanning diadenylate cyclase DisA [Blastococcus sp. BMG 8361]WRL64550.1 DNA integrity scanning diadenylate cyclase DisA [Blastococcus sp. BMG 8361]
MPTEVDPEVALRELLGRIAPGTALRDGLERILAGRTGALIVLGYDRVVESLCTGGFALDVALSATRLRELAKMDGAVIVSYDGTRIVRAGVHLMPDPTIPTEESGTRHRTAERVALQTGFPVISVSQSMHIISVYVAARRYTLEHPTTILARANQALAALERYKLRLDEVASTLSALEIEDLVTVRDAMSVSQRLEMVRRIADEIEGFVVELGTDGRLLALQLDEMLAGVEEDRGLLVRDYLPNGGRRPRTIDQVLTDLRALTATELLDLSAVARCYGLPTSPDALDSPSARAATACSTGCLGCRRGSSTGWSITSAGCRSCWPPPSRTCWPSRGRRGAGPRDPRGPLAARRDLDPRPLQLGQTRVSVASGETLVSRRARRR